MVKPLSEQLSDMAAHAKSAEDAIAAAQRETQEKIAERRDQVHATASEALAKVQQEVKSMEADASARQTSLKAKVDHDVAALKATIKRKHHDLDVRNAERHAEMLEEEATFAIDYAIATIEDAKLAVIDAVAGRMQAAQVQQQR